MFNPTKRFLAFMLAVLVGLLALPEVTPEVKADSIVSTDAYVLSYDGAVEGYAYGDYPYMYKSPFKMHHAYSDPAAGNTSVWDYTYTNEIFHLINTSKIGQGSGELYASIPAYCTDADTGTRTNSYYRRLNLEDSTYHASGAAGRLRSVILNSFPYIQNMDTIESNANVYLSSNGDPVLENLQIGEAMLATQQAIWEITHGEKYTILDPYTGIGTYDGSDSVYTGNAEEKETEFTRSNIIGLYNYLLALSPTAPMDDVVSEFSFENVLYNDTKNSDGTYTVTVSCDVNTNIKSTDSLTIGAQCGESVQSLPLTEAGNYSFAFSGLAMPSEVLLEINGTQSGGDVYLFDVEGDRSQSQSLIGYDSSVLPVHGEVVASPERIVNIYKTTSEEDGKKPLSNIQFDIYRAATMTEIEQGEVVLGEHPSDSEMEAFQTAERYITTLTTDITGHAFYNFTDNGHPDGVYLVVEKPNSATLGPVEPFYLVIPETTEDGLDHVYSITVNPKNTTETDPEIQKDVTKIDNDHDTYDVGQIHTWIIRSDIPAGLANGLEYMISDTLDYRLTYTKGSPQVKLYHRGGEEISLTAGTHFQLEEGTTTVSGYKVDRFSVSLTKEGMKYVAENLHTGEAIPEIRVYFTAQINSHAAMGEEIPNQAHLDYTNSANVSYDDDSDIPEVHTGGIHILKTDVADNTLKGASFRVAREATAAELADEAIEKQILTVGEQELTVVFVDFYDNCDLLGEKVTEVVTDDEGKAVMYGLAYGTYYIVETKAPAGYNLLNAPIRIVISKYSHLTSSSEIYDDTGKLIDNTLRVINTKYILPETGGMGTTLFTAAGLGIIVCAMFLLITNRKKRI